jgi:hypothetical protein
MFCFRYISVNTLHKGDAAAAAADDNNNNNNNNTTKTTTLKTKYMHSPHALKCSNYNPTCSELITSPSPGLP